MILALIKGTFNYRKLLNTDHEKVGAKKLGYDVIT
jgi:hypothetical protein